MNIDLGQLSFSRYCNKDSKTIKPIMSLFTSSFSTCMDACASYTMYIPRKFGRSANTTCGAAVFVPKWTGKTNASEVKAPGNCYLKPKLDTSVMHDSKPGNPCHTGIWNDAL